MRGLALVESIRPRMDPEVLASLLRNDDLQQQLKEDEPFQDLIGDVVLMNKTDRAYFQNDPTDKHSNACVSWMRPRRLSTVCSRTCARIRSFVSGRVVVREAVRRSTANEQSG
jgi:hypothetical protein